MHHLNLTSLLSLLIIVSYYSFISFLYPSQIALEYVFNFIHHFTFSLFTGLRECYHPFFYLVHLFFLKYFYCIVQNWGLGGGLQVSLLEYIGELAYSTMAFLASFSWVGLVVQPHS